MPRQYKRKRLAELWSNDERTAKKDRKPYNSSERQRGKRIAASHLQEWPSAEEMEYLRYVLGRDQREACGWQEMHGPTAQLGGFLYKLGFGWNSLHKCNCHNTNRLTNEEVLVALGYWII